MDRIVVVTGANRGIERLAGAVERDHGRLDALVNNAAILYDTPQRGADPGLETLLALAATSGRAAWGSRSGGRWWGPRPVPGRAPGGAAGGGGWARGVAARPPPGPARHDLSGGPVADRQLRQPPAIGHVGPEPLRPGRRA